MVLIKQIKVDIERKQIFKDEKTANNSNFKLIITITPRRKELHGAILGNINVPKSLEDLSSIWYKIRHYIHS